MGEKQSFLESLPAGFVLGAGIILGVGIAYGVIPFIARAFGGG